MHKPLKECWRRSNNHRDNSDEQILRVYCNNEEIKTFSDAIRRKEELRSQKPKLIGVYLSSQEKTLYKVPLNVFLSRSNNLSRDCLGPKILIYLRAKLGDYIDYDDIKVCLKWFQNVSKWLTKWSSKVGKFNSVSCNFEALGDIDNNDVLKLVARQTSNWRHARLNQSKEKSDFLAIYGPLANDEEVHGIRKYEVARVLCPLRLYTANRIFDVVFVEEYSRLNFSIRAQSFKYVSTANVASGKGFNLIELPTIFRPIHLTPNWDCLDEKIMYLNQRTDVHAWMHFWWSQMTQNVQGSFLWERSIMKELRFHSDEKYFELFWGISKWLKMFRIDFDPVCKIIADFKMTEKINLWNWFVRHFEWRRNISE